MTTDDDKQHREVREQRKKLLLELLAINDEEQMELGGRTNVAAQVPDEPPPEQLFKSKLARLPLGDAAIEYLYSCKKPQTIREVTKGLQNAGREFEASNPVRAVKDALKKALPAKPDLFHIRYGRWHLRSKHSKAALEKLLAENSTHGTGGRSAHAHALRTRKGMEKARAAGKQIGAVRIMTDEKIAELKSLILAGNTTKEACDKAGVSVGSFIAYQQKGAFKDLPDRRGRRKSKVAPVTEERQSELKLRVVK